MQTGAAPRRRGVGGLEEEGGDDMWERGLAEERRSLYAIERLPANHRLEKDERERKWFTIGEAEVKLTKWGPLLPGGEDEEGEMSRGGAKKKAVKGDAMLKAFRSFTEKNGWKK